MALTQRPWRRAEPRNISKAGATAHAGARTLSPIMHRCSAFAKFVSRISVSPRLSAASYHSVEQNSTEHNTGMRVNARCATHYILFL